MTLADFRVGLAAYLYADSAINAMVEGNVLRTAGGQRVFPVKLLQGVTKDSIVYQRISGMGVHHSQGASGLVRPRIQIDCYSLSADRATVLGNLVKERIDGFSGNMPWGENSPAEDIVIQGIFFDGERDDYDDVTKLYRLSRDYLIWHAER